MTETNDSTIYELFQRNPLEYRTGDLDTIIATLREKRKHFDLTGSSAKLEKNPKKAKAKSELSKIDISLDLDL